MVIFHFFIFEVLSFITKYVIQFKKSHVFTCNCSLNREMYGNATMRGCGTNAVCTVPCCLVQQREGNKDRLISEGILTLVPLPTKFSKLLSWAKNLNRLFTTMGEKMKFCAQKSDMAPYVGNGTRIKIPFEIKQPLEEKQICLGCMLHNF